MPDNTIFAEAEKLHQKAIAHADRARSFLDKSPQLAEDIYKQASAIEAMAAKLLPATEEYEPSRSILFRSAASMSYKGRDFKVADKLVADGLRGFAPAEIEKELKDLYDDINFMRHIQNQGLILTESGFSVTIAGEKAYHGGARLKHVIKKLQHAEKLFYRTAYRMLGLEFEAKYKERKDVDEKYDLYAEVQFASSYGIYVQVAHPPEQLSIFPDDNASAAIDAQDIILEVSSCLEIWNSGSPEALQEKISDREYYENFVHLAKQFAPDGNEINTVGFNSLVDGKPRPVVIHRTSRHWSRAEAEAHQLPSGEENDSIPFRTEGEIVKASTPENKKCWISIKNLESNQKTKVFVNATAMKDAVKPYYEEYVTVTGQIINGKHYLTDIASGQQPIEKEYEDDVSS